MAKKPMPELKPCFCGRKARAVPKTICQRPHRFIWFIATGCKCPKAPAGNSFPSKLLAIRMWNKWQEAQAKLIGAIFGAPPEAQEGMKP
jgi:hypothetical protein